VQVCVRGGGKTSQVYAIMQAIVKALIMYAIVKAAKEVKEIFSRYNGTLLVTDPAAASPRSLAVVAPSRGSKNLTVEWRAVGVLLQWWTYPAALLV
jgi:ribosomal protein S9